MAQQQVNVVAVITPAPGKKDRVEELLQGLAKEVHEHEPDVLRYHLYYQEATGEFVMIERYTNEKALENHNRQEWFLSVLKAAQGENLLSKPLELKLLKPIGGFEDR